MKILDCTPPANLPDIVLVQAKDTFWLRIKTSERSVETKDLVNGATLPGARREARDLGFEPAAWVGLTGTIHRF